MLFSIVPLHYYCNIISGENKVGKDNEPLTMDNPGDTEMKHMALYEVSEIIL